MIDDVQPIAGATEHSTKLRGIDFHWLQCGDGGAPPLVLLHGLTGHARTWDHMAPALAARFCVYAPDQRGHGDTGAGDTYTTQDFVDDLEALRQHWKLDRFALMGLSMGGHNAIAYAAAHPQRVERLIVVDIPPRIDRTRAPNWAMISRLAEEGHKLYTSFDEAFADARLGNPTAPDDNLRYRTALNLRDVPGGWQWKYDPAAPARWEPADLTDALPSMQLPVLLVRGGLTQVLPRATADAMVAAWPNADLVEIADSGHSVPTDRPEKLTPIVLDWLEGIRSQRASA
jgi:pimeloyl-ACP methyl ester carboxylesterase